MQTPDLRKFLEKHGTGDDVFPEPERFQKPVTAEGNPPASNPQAAAKDAKEAECLRRIRTIGAAASLYSQDYDGTLPRTIDQLIGNYLPEHPTTRAELISPFASDNKTPSYEFVTPGAKLPDLKPDSIIIRSLFMAPGNRRSIYRANGTAEMIQDK